MTTVQFIILGAYSGMFFIFLGVAFFYKFRYRLLRGRLRIRVLSETGRDKTFVIKSDATEGAEIHLTIDGKPRTFEVHRSALIFTGAEEMPTLEYNAEDSSPVSRGSEERQVSSIRFREVAKNTIMRDLLESFKKKLITNEAALIITVVVVLISTLALGIFMNDKLTKINDAVTKPVIVSDGTVLE